MYAQDNPKPRIWHIPPQATFAELSGPAGMLRDGGVAIYPTETFYALGGVPLVPEAVARIFDIKGRDFDKPLPLIASDRDAVMRAVSEWPEIAERLAKAFWPGPLTIVLPASPKLPSTLHAGTGKIAVRISSHPVAAMLAEASGGLLVSTSANKSGEPAPVRLGEIPQELRGNVDGIVDSGVLAGGLPSTIVDLAACPPVLVRAGAIDWEEIRKAIEPGIAG